MLFLTEVRRTSTASLFLFSRSQRRTKQQALRFWIKFRTDSNPFTSQTKMSRSAKYSTIWWFTSTIQMNNLKELQRAVSFVVCRMYHPEFKKNYSHIGVNQQDWAVILIREWNSYLLYFMTKKKNLFGWTTQLYFLWRFQSYLTISTERFLMIWNWKTVSSSH